MVDVSDSGELDCPDAEALGGKICAAAGLAAQSECRLLELIGDHGRCQFTGCHQTHHLKAHHLIHWADGGPTDLDLILLCQFHHTAVHEGQMTIRRSADRTWEFVMPDGRPHRGWWTAASLLAFLTQHAVQALVRMPVSTSGNQKAA